MWYEYCAWGGPIITYHYHGYAQCKSYCGFTTTCLGMQDEDEIVVHNTSISNNSNWENVVNYSVHLHNKGKTKATNSTSRASHDNWGLKGTAFLSPHQSFSGVASTSLIEIQMIFIIKNTVDEKNMFQEAVGHMLPSSEIGGKAGKSHLFVQMGEVQTCTRQWSHPRLLNSNTHKGGVSCKAEWKSRGMGGYCHDGFIPVRDYCCDCLGFCLQMLAEMVKYLSRRVGFGIFLRIT